MIPERALVFEVIGPISNVARFVAAARSAGFDWLGEDFVSETEEDEGDGEGDEQDSGDSEASQERGQGMLYVTLPTLQGLQKLLSLWKRFAAGDDRPESDDGQWWPLFKYLSDIRPWSPKDRVDPGMARYVDRMMRQYPDRRVRMELDLWFRSNAELREAAEGYVSDLMELIDGVVLDFVTIPEIRYQAALIEVSNHQALRLAELEGPLSTADWVMRVRPQSLYTSEVGDTATSYTDFPPVPVASDPRESFIALLDGYPVDNHALLRNRLRIQEVDVSALEVPVAKRRHGTGMASLILHGDLGNGEPPLDRVLHVVPVLGAMQNLAMECTPQGKLPIGVVYRAVMALVEGLNGAPPAARNVVVINHSICDTEGPFSQRPSFWAKLLDYLSHQYKLLFIVSAGNSHEPFVVDGYRDAQSFASADAVERQIAILSALDKSRASRVMLAPAESINALTVGAVHGDSSNGTPLGAVDPFDSFSGVTNLASSIGLGVNRAIKPDILEFGGRQLVQSDDDGGVLSAWAWEHPDVGQLTAAPGVGASVDNVRRSTGTSNAAALTTRAAARLVDVLEGVYEESGSNWAESRTRAVVLKALLSHGCVWGPAGEILYNLYGGKALKKKEAVSRVLGYGRPDHSRVVSADGSRITLLADDIISHNALHEYRLPIPRAMMGNRELRRVIITLAWSSPVDPLTQRYRGVRLEVVDRDNKRDFWKGVKRVLAPDGRVARRGTLQHLVFEGTNLVKAGGAADFFLGVQAMAEMKPFEGTEVPYGLAITLEMGDSIRTDLFADVESRVRTKRVGVTQRIPTRVRS